MEYDPDRKRYVGKDGSEFKVTPYSDGSGYKYDYYDSSTYNNSSHNSTHVKSDLNENWERTDNDRDNGTQEQTSGSGCFLTTACLKHKETQFNDDCDELMTLRWFRDNYVSKEDIKYYYEIAPIIVEKLNFFKENDIVYDWIYNNVVLFCFNAIKKGNYELAYKKYKNSVLALENLILKLKTNDEKVIIKSLKKLK